MTEKTINFWKRYSKLSKPIHTTIRTHQNWKVGHLYPETVNRKFLQNIIVIDLQRVRLVDINPIILIEDTDSETVEEAFEKLTEIKKKVCENKNIPYSPYDFEKHIFSLYFLQITTQRQINLREWLLSSGGNN